MPAPPSVPEPLHRVAVVVVLVGCLGLPACGGPAEPGVAPSSGAASVPTSTPPPAETSDSATADEPTADVVVEITIADGTVSPNGEKVEVAAGQQVVLNVTSDTDDEIHAHTDAADGYELEVTAGEPATGSFRVSSPGSFEVESHRLEKTIVILNVR